MMDEWLYTLLAVLLATLVIFHVLFPNFLRDLRTITGLSKVHNAMFSGESFLVRFNAVVREGGRKAAMINALTGEEVSFHQLDERSNQVANWAIGVGLAEGQTVALLGPSTPEFVVWWLGLVKAGLCVAFLNFNLRGRSLAHCVKTCRAAAFVVLSDAEGKLLSTAEEVWPSCKEEDQAVRFFSVGGEADGATRVDEDVTAAIGDKVIEKRDHPRGSSPLLYLFTSGTTGLPKAAMISHNKLKAFTVALSALYRVTSKDVVYVSVPVYHASGGLLGVGTILGAAVTIVIRPKFSARAFWMDIKKYKCTSFLYVGELCRYLLTQPPSDLDRQHGARLGIGNGLRPDIWDKFADRFGVLCGEFYGATEGNVAFFNHTGKRRSIGALPWLIRRQKTSVLLKYDHELGVPVRDEKTGLCIEVKVGEKGLLAAKISKKSPFVGYTNKDETQKKVLEDVIKKGDTYFNSGDLLSMDENGWLYFHDRAGDTFRWKSENVSTTQVAEIVTMFNGIAECTVYGVTVPQCDGRAGMAALVLEEGAEINWKQFLSFLEKQLPPYAHPVFLRIQQELPLTSTFKYSKVQLVKDGFSPNEMEDNILYRDVSQSTYSKLTKDIHEQIVNAELRL